jgi:Mrp family chromosome partitioning ATPase
MADITIGIIASAREWRSVLQAHVRDHVAGVRVQILREPRMALELDLDVVVIDDVSSFLTRDKVVRLREKGTRVVGIYDEEGHEGLGVQFLENLGVDLSLPSNISPEEMINAVSQLQPRESYTHTFDHIVAGYETGAPGSPAQGESTLIAVSGPAGTGSTEVAIALADVLVSRRKATLLLDSDEIGPSIARRLGYALHPNILSAIDTVSNVTRPLTEMVGRPGDRAASAINFDVIPGIANPEDWAQLRSMDMDDLFAAARKSWRYIVCNTGPFAEDLSGYGIERFGATRATLTAADVIIGVMSPTPTGYMRFLDWMASLRTLGADRQVFIVVNNTPKSSYIQGEIESQLARDIDPRYFAGLFFIAHDEKVPKAEWEGQKVARGAFLTGVAEVASYAVPMDHAKAQKSKGNAVQQNYAGNPQTYGGYQAGVVPSAPPSPNPVSVSWDDPDIANPPAPQASIAPDPFATPAQSTAPISLDEPPSAFFESQSANISDAEELEHSLSVNMDDQTEMHPQSAQTNAEPYTFSPPQHAVESFPTAQPQAPVQPQAPTAPTQNQEPAPDALSEGYVPAFKRGNETPSSAEFVQSPPPPPAQPSTYTQPPAAPTQAEPGYVPHFLDEKGDEDEEPESFWK